MQPADLGHALRVMVQAAEAFKGVAQRKVPDVVEQCRGPRDPVGGVDVRDEAEQAERVLEARVRLRGHERDRPRVGDQAEPSHGPRPEQVRLKRGELRDGPPRGVHVHTPQAERVGDHPSSPNGHVGRPTICVAVTRPSAPPWRSSGERADATGRPDEPSTVAARRETWVACPG